MKKGQRDEKKREGGVGGHNHVKSNRSEGRAGKQWSEDRLREGEREGVKSGERVMRGRAAG